MNTTVIVELPAAIQTELKGNADQTISLIGKTPEWFVWAIAFGVRQSCSDADASLKGKSDAEKAAAVLKKFQKVAIHGEIPKGGGGGRSLGELEIRLRQILVSKLTKAVDFKRADGTTGQVKGMALGKAQSVAKDPQDALFWLVRRALQSRGYRDDQIFDANGPTAATQTLIDRQLATLTAEAEAELAREAAERATLPDIPVDALPDITAVNIDV